MTPGCGLSAGWLSITAAAGLASAAIVQALAAVAAGRVQPLGATGIPDFICPGAVAQFVHGLICGCLPQQVDAKTMPGLPLGAAERKA